MDSSARAAQINSLLADLSASEKCSNPAAKLLQLKDLAKHPSGSQILAAPHNLRLLLSFATHKYADSLDAKCEALRSIANCLLLVEQARATFTDDAELVVLGEEVQGGHICFAELEKSTHHQLTFVLARILFLSTVSKSSFLVAIVEQLNGISILSSKLSECALAVVSGEAFSTEAMTDLLKFAFNLLLHYPKLAGQPQHAELASAPLDQRKIIGDYWSDKLDGVLAPLLLAFERLPPTTLANNSPTPSDPSSSEDALLALPPALSPAPLLPPLTQVIHSLISIPINSGLKPIWFSTYPPTTEPTDLTKGNSKEEKKSKTGSSSPILILDKIPKSSAAAAATSSSPPGASGSHSSSPSKIERALNVLNKTRRSLSRSPTPQADHEDAKPQPHYPNVDVLGRAFSLLDAALELYLPGEADPDDATVRGAIMKHHPTPPALLVAPSETGSLDDPVAPLLVLISRLCAADATCRRRLRAWLVPKTLDRSTALETHSSVLGRLLRLLSSVYHSNTKDAAGEVLYAMCNSDASTLAALVGYGNVAGFLFNKGIMSAPPPPEKNDNDDDIPQDLPDPTTIDPITGTTQQPKDRRVQDEMTEEEKEQEMEKLFVLFDRLEKTGAIKPENNPVRSAIHKGMAS